MNSFVFPETARQALARWDAGLAVFSADMGGLGPSYEQAIQIAVFELVRDHLDVPLPTAEGEIRKWGEATLARVDSELHMSPWQQSAARSLAFRVLRDGWRKTLAAVQDDRIIQVSKRFPALEPA